MAPREATAWRAWNETTKIRLLTMTHSSSSAADEAEVSTPVVMQVEMYVKKVRKYVVPVVVMPLAAVAASLILTGNLRIVMYWMLLPSWNFLLRIVGTTIGIGLGLGLAAHVHDQLEVWHESDEETHHAEPTLARSRSATLRSSKSTHMEDETSYSALMTVAGYDVSDQMLRGQIVRKSSPFFRTNYPYTDAPEEEQAGPKIMTEQWPHLPKQISHEIGRWIEFIVRDFVASWYSYIDEGCPYENEKEKRAKMSEQSASEAKESLANERAMIFRTGPHRPIPLMTAMYHALGVIFGNLASRAEHVNVMSLVLLKWTRVIAHKLKTYRQLRKLAVAKEARKTPMKSSLHAPVDNESGEQHREYHPLSEMAMTKEFLLAGKLHRAVTFGMDVPSLLFSDASGKECRAEKAETDEQVLEERLFTMKMVYDCELDYNRVLGQRLLRAVLPRSEYSSPVIRTMLTELLSGCVLAPIMGCFSPDYLNSWIVSGLEAMAVSNEVDKEATGEDVLMRGWDDNEIESSVEVPLESTLLDDLDEGDTTVEPRESREVVEIIANGNDASEGEEHVELQLTLDDLGDDLEHDHAENVKIDGIPIAESSDEDDDTHGVSDLQKSESQVCGDYILPLLTMAIIDLQRFVDFNMAREGNEENPTNWDDTACQEAVRQVVLVIEAALTHGRRKQRLTEKKPISPTEICEKDENVADEEEEVADSDEETLLPFHAANLSQVLMELTSDVDAFEARIVVEEKRLENEQHLEAEDSSSPTRSQPSVPELSTLRTLISAWLHTGQVYKAFSVLIKARRSILVPYFHDDAFLRKNENSEGFAWQLRALDGVDIMVDTTSILASSVLGAEGRHESTQEGVSHTKSVTIQSSTSPSVGNQSVHRSLRAGSLSLSGARRSGVRLQRFITGATTEDPDHEIAASPKVSAGMSTASFSSAGATPRYLDFRRNENFASSLRDERERRMQSWQNVTASMVDQGLKLVHRQKESSEGDIEVHRDLHRLARTFYSGINFMALKDGCRRKLVDIGADASLSGPTTSSAPDDATEISRVSLLTVEMSGSRRKIEIPDDDSSFLIRAQPRPLNAVSIHVDQRDHSQSYKAFAAAYEEPANPPGSNRYNRGRYIRRCTIKYYPNDRTATVELPAQSTRSLDYRRVTAGPPTTIQIGSQKAESLSGDFLRKRHLCQKWLPHGAAPRSGGSILASPAMEPSDFHSVPRAGKSVDFIYRMSLFEYPMVELSGKKFTVHDSSMMGETRADASAMELSDASLSAVLLTAGRDWESFSPGSIEWKDDEVTTKIPPPGLEMGPDGYPIVWVKLYQKQGEKVTADIKPYRASYVRAALWLASTRVEAQRQCLLTCVRSGSARNATRSRVDSLLIPTQRLLQFANSPEREQQLILMRDLKLGINHIDREQLRRNKLLYPRHPTNIRALTVLVEGFMPAKDTGMTFAGTSSTTIVYKIRCVAIVELIDTDDERDELQEYGAGDSSGENVFREEWVVYRQFGDFNALHKHLKTQVAISETSGSAGTRLMGAFAGGVAPTGVERRRKVLIPSLGQASKAGALGITHKAMEKRRAVLHSYMQHLLAPNHPMRLCTEILIFVGAFHAFPSEIRTGEVARSFPDSLGRTEMVRSVYHDTTLSPRAVNALEKSERDSVRSIQETAGESTSVGSESLRMRSFSVGESTASAGEDTRAPNARASRAKEIDNMPPAIKAKIDQVPLGKVRHAIFEIIRSHFDLENASFFRNRLLAALKTLSFAVAGNAEFRKMLYGVHKTQLSAEAIAGWIKMGLEMLWPDGVFYESSPPLTPEESDELVERAKTLLTSAFPDQVRAILGSNIADDGVDILHEMLQNRMVVKSLFYMLFDLLWLEIFPELHDILTCGSALETD